MRKETTLERDLDLLNAYKQSLSEAEYPFLLSDVILAAIRKPAKKFYCATRGVYEAVRAIKQGIPPGDLGEERTRLVNDVYDKVVAMQKDNPETPLKHLVEIVLDGPAPEFYLKKTSAIVILHHIQKQARHIEKIKNISRNERIKRRKNR